MKKILVNRKFIEDARGIAYDLCVLAGINGDEEIKKEMKAFMRKADKFLERMESE